MPKLNLPYEFIAIQLAFARRMSELSHLPMADTLIECTNIRTLLNIHVTLKTAAETDAWQTFVSGLHNAQNPDRWAYEHYLEREKTEPEVDTSTGFGCFYYSYPFRDQPAVRLHFRNVDHSGNGALSLKQNPIRRHELTALFREVMAQHPDAKTVRGGSWLYNIEPYCRLFPKEYISTMKPVGYELQFWALWGQFLRGGFQPNIEAITKFRNAIIAAKSPKECEQCFPYEVMRPECNIEHFYRHFGLAD